MKRLTGFLALSLVVLASGCQHATLEPTTSITVAAASSLTDALTIIGKLYEGLHKGQTVHFTFGASGNLEKQIEQGAPVDVFVSASPKEMDALERNSLLQTGTRQNIAANQLVLVRPLKGKVGGWKELGEAPVRHIAISDPETVPSGRYAKQTLQKKGLWEHVQDKLVFGQTVRQTLSYASGGNADAAIVFATDALSAKGTVEVVAEANATDHDPILYPAAAIARANGGEAASDFVKFLRTAEAQATLRKLGFSAPGG